MFNSYQIADRAIAAYDAYVFASVGRAFDGGKADILAFDAAECCKTASRDQSINAFTRNIYREQSIEFYAIFSD